MDRDKLLKLAKKGAKYSGIAVQAAIGVATGGGIPGPAQRGTTSSGTSAGPAASLLFDSTGRCVAWRDGGYLYSFADGSCVGFSPFSNDDFAAPDGTYLCSVRGEWLVRANVPPFSGVSATTAQMNGIPPTRDLRARLVPNAPSGYDRFRLGR